jgi:PAS domain S-box-containing protein
VQAVFHLQRFDSEQAREMQIQVEIARAVAVTFRTAVEFIAKDVYAAGLVILQLAPDRDMVVRFLSATQERYPAAAELAWLSLDGRVIASSHSDEIGKDRSSEGYLSGLGATRPWAIGSLQQSPAQNSAVFTVSHLLHDEKGKLHGIMTATIKAEKFGELRFEIFKAPDVGFIIIDKKGYVAFQRPHLPFTEWNSRNYSEKELVAEALSGREATGKMQVPLKGEVLLAAYTPVPDLGWVAGAGRDYEKVLSPLWRDLMVGMGLSFLFLLISGAIALYYGKGILTDLQEFHGVIKSWGSSYGTAALLKVRNVMELKSIAAAFDEMIESRRKAEEALRRSEEEFRTIFHATHEGAILLNNERIILKTNPAAGRVTGLPYESLVGRFLDEFMDPEFLMDAEWPLFMETGTFNGEVRIRHRDGMFRILVAAGAAHILPGQHLFVGLDITERRQAEMQLKEIANKYSTLFNTTSDGVLIHTLKGDIVEVNDAYCKMTGYTRDELLRMHMAELDKSETMEDPSDFIKKLIMTGGRDRFESAHRRKDGTFFDVDVTTFYFGVDEGSVAVFVRNITERKRSEEALAYQRELLERVFDNIPVLLAMLNSRLEHFMLNRYAENILGWTTEEANIIDLMTELFPDDAYRAEVTAYMQSGAPGYHEWICTAKSGKHVPIDWAHIHLADDTTIAIGVDLTERKHAEETLKQLNETLERRVKERTELAEERAHQLQVMASRLTVAEHRERRRIAEVLHDHLQQFLLAAKMHMEVVSSAIGNTQKQSVDTVIGLLMEAMQVSRSLTAELSPPFLKQGRFSEALEWLARWMYEKHGLKVELKTSGGDPGREDISVLLFQSIRELLLNVVKHSGAESAKVDVFRDKKNRFHIIVTDRGRGFDPDTTVWGKMRSSPGLGLFSIQERLMLLGGSMEIKSAPGRGASFILIVPHDTDGEE